MLDLDTPLRLQQHLLSLRSRLTLKSFGHPVSVAADWEQYRRTGGWNDGRNHRPLDATGKNADRGYVHDENRMTESRTYMYLGGLRVSEEGGHVGPVRRLYTATASSAERQNGYAVTR